MNTHQLLRSITISAATAIIAMAGLESAEARMPHYTSMDGTRFAADNRQKRLKRPLPRKLTVKRPDLIVKLPYPMNGKIVVRNIGAAAAGPTKLTISCKKAGYVGPGGGCAEIPPALAAPYVDAAFPNKVVVQIPALAAGAQYSHKLAFWNSLKWKKGKYNFKAYADAANSVAEIKETNNHAYSTLIK